MSSNSPFPKKPQSLISRVEVVEYLLQHHQRGYQIYEAGAGFELVLNESQSIKIPNTNGGKVQVQSYTMNTIVNFIDCSSLPELQRAVDALAQQLVGPRWERSPTTARVSADTPATNLATISRLIGAAAVEAVFDPYLANSSLATLVNILSFGNGSVVDGVRILSTGKTTRGQAPQLTRVGFDAWLTELGITGEIRIMASNEHRRFMLLSGGQSLILGHSLNAIDKNEALRIESDREDRAFFEQMWATANVLT